MTLRLCGDTGTNDVAMHMNVVRSGLGTCNTIICMYFTVQRGTACTLRHLSCSRFELSVPEETIPSLGETKFLHEQTKACFQHSIRVQDGANFLLPQINGSKRNFFFLFPVLKSRDNYHASRMRNELVSTLACVEELWNRRDSLLWTRRRQYKPTDNAALKITRGRNYEQFPL